MPNEDKKPSLLIIDCDVIAFTAAAVNQRVVQDELGNVTYMGFMDEAVASAAGLLAKYRNHLGREGNATEMVMVLSDPNANWRYDVDRNYKSNRKGIFTPQLLGPLKQWFKDNYDVQITPRCEADDTISLLMTDPALADFNRIAVGRDKDFKSIPGWHYQMKQGHTADDIKPFYIPVEEADRWHLIQSLAGDLTDGFPGCPGIGVVRAARIIDECALLVPEEGVITRGKNAGQKCVKWNKVPAESVWDCIVSNYQKAGLGEMEALMTARCARLLRHGEYDNETHEVKLWLPNQQNQ